ncbi:MAG: BlaI/MecI/CopY family transcriptional regulator [Bacteroidota bacterium]
MEKEKQLLTPLELKVMNILWSLKKAFVKDIIAKWPDQDNLPKYNTVSTIVRILEEKGYVGHESFGRSHEYYPLIKKGSYQKKFMTNVLENVFSGSLNGMISSLLDNEQLQQKDLQALKNFIEKNDQE